MGQALLVPSRKKLSIMSTRPALWLSASSGIGTTGARSFAAARQEHFELASFIQAGTSDYWFSWWVYRNSTTPTDTFFRAYGAGVQDHRISFHATQTGMHLWHGSTDYHFTNAGCTAGSWIHYALSVDRDGLASLYKNGILVQTLDVSATAASSLGAATLKTVIGSQYSGIFFDGRLSRMAYGTGLLTDAEALQLYNQGNGMFYAELPASIDAKTVHYWNLNESALSAAIDAKGTNDGAISGGNLLTNPGFETLGGGGADVFADWTESVAGASTVTDGGAGNADAGSRCACLTVDGSASACGVYQPVLTIGRRYQWSVRAKGTNGLQIKLTDDTNSSLITLTASYQTFTWTLASAASTIARISRQDASVTAYVDTVSLTSAQIDSAAGPREATAADTEGGYHGVLTNMDAVSSWSTDTPDGSYTATKVDSVGTAHGTMTGFTDIDAAHVDGPDGSWGPHIPNDGSDGASIDGWLLSSVKDSRSASVPSSLNTRIFDEQYTEPASTGSRWLDSANAQRFAMGSAPAYGTGDFSFEAWFYRADSGRGQYVIGTGAGGTNAGASFYVNSGNSFQLDVANGSSKLSATLTAAPQYAWTHITGVFRRAGNMELWVNGALVAATDISSFVGASLTPGAGTHAVGSLTGADATYMFGGALSRVRFYIGNALSAAEIAESYNGGKGRAYSELSTALQAKVTHSYSMSGASGAGETCEKASGNNLTVGGTGTISSAASPYLPAYDATLTGFTSSPRSSDVPTALVGKCKSIRGTATGYATTGQKTVTGLGARSVSFWFKRSGSPATQESLIAECASLVTHYGLNAWITTAGMLQVSIAKGHATDRLVLISKGLVCDGAWHHAVLTWDGTTDADKAILYFDGAVAATFTATGTSQGGASNYNTQVFGYNGATATSTALICRPQVFAGRALTAGEVATLYAGGDVTEGLTAEWRFNEPDAIAVPFEHALKCDGSASRVDCGAEIIGTGAQTISGWVNASGLGGSGVGRICDNGKSEFNLYSGPSIRYSSDAVSVAQTVSGAIATGSWYHIAVARTATGHAQIFVNGNRVSLTTISTGNAGTPTGGSTNLYIGNRSDAARAFDGLIGGVRIDSGVLTQAQIRQLAMGQSPATPKASWQFDKPLDLPYLSGCKAVRFDGVDDRATTGSATTISSNALTITGWINPNSTGGGGGGRIIDNGSTIFLIGSTGYLSFSSVNGTPLVSSAANAYSMGVWQHVAVTRDAAGLCTLYINGVLTGTADTSSGTPVAGSTATNIGNRNGADRGFDGMLADVRIYDGVRLTQAQIRSLIAGTDFRTGISAQWKFGETPRSIPSCAGGYSLTFDGIDDKVVAPNLDNMPEITVSVWSKIRTLQDGETIAVWPVWYMRVKADTSFSVALATDDDAFTGFTTAVGQFKQGQWHHIAFTYKTGELKLYVDGVQVGATVTTVTGDLIDNTASIEMGGTSTKFAGNLDDPRIYLSALSASDIAILAAGGDPTTNPIAHWPLDDGPQYGEPSNGDPICVWESKDGGRINFVQTNHSACPTYVQSGINGRPCIAFDGVAQFMSTVSPVLSATNGGRLWAVVKQVSTTAGVIFAQADVGGTSESMRFGVTSDHIQMSQFKSAATNSVEGSSALGTSAAHIVEVTTDGMAWRMLADGTLQSLSTSGSNNGDWFGDLAGIDNASIGARLTASASLFSNIWMAELVICDRPVSDVEAVKVRRILAAAYGITLAS